LKLRTRKLLLNLATLAALLLAVAAVSRAWQAEIEFTDPASDLLGQQTAVNSPADKPQASKQKLAAIDARQPQWQRPLRRPLYDPPPQPEKKIIRKPRPITVKLMGTILEQDASQAFVKQSTGSVQLKRLGDQLTDNRLDGTIEVISAGEIVVKREDGDVRIPVEGQK
jgi:hypothetical protein